jgi:uncharacterized protein
MSRSQTVAQQAQAPEASPLFVLRHVEWSDRHQALRIEIRERRQLLQQLVQFGGVRCKPGLGFLMTQLDFEQYRQAFSDPSSRLVQPLCQLQRIHRIDGIEDLRSLGSLIRLQMPNQVHANFVTHSKRSQLRRLRRKLLHPVLAKQVQPQPNPFNDGGGWMIFGDRNQFNLVARPAGSMTRGSNGLFQPREILADCGLAALMLAHVCCSRRNNPCLPVFIQPAMWTVILLILSNICMTIAWYGHLKYRQDALWKVILVSWGIAFFEYCLQVPANRIGSERFSPVQLKVIQEIVTLCVFAVFTMLYFGTRLHWNHAAAAVCLVAAAFFVFKPW